jgi:murein DD-endopeptidase MepM/ murein hydrolase activator NlpD
MLVEPATCPVCGSKYDPLRARAVAVQDGRIRAFCSDLCKLRGVAPVNLVISDPDDDLPVAKVPRWKKLAPPAVVFTSVVGFLMLVLAPRLFHTTLPAAAMVLPKPAPPPAAPTADEAMAILSKPTPSQHADLWFHPLAGPKRKMPKVDSRRFGAARDGLRPEECMEGHCGVDLGDAKGEPIMAAHDGVIERVVRDPELGGRRGNEGRFIRINHRGGTVVTSYMHLDGIRADLAAGTPVKAGEVIASVGDTGVHHSGPHLHFAISVRATPDGSELFINPEPLLHLWALKPTAPKTLQAMEPSPPPRKKTAKADTEEATEGM